MADICLGSPFALPELSQLIREGLACGRPDTREVALGPLNGLKIVSRLGVHAGTDDAGKHSRTVCQEGICFAPCFPSHRILQGKGEEQQPLRGSLH